MNKNLTPRTIAFTALFTALIVVGTFIKVTVIPPVPIVLATMFVLLSGMILGKYLGLYSVCIYLLMGAIGLPVFSQGGGIANLFGFTGGFLFGYALAAFFVGLILEKMNYTLIGTIVAAFAGTLLIYVPGLPWLKFSLDWSWAKTISSGFLPFVLGDSLKLVAAVLIYVALKKALPDFLLSFQKTVASRENDV